MPPSDARSGAEDGNDRAEAYPTILSSLVATVHRSQRARILLLRVNHQWVIQRRLADEGSCREVSNLNPRQDSSSAKPPLNDRPLVKSCELRAKPALGPSPLRGRNLAECPR